MLPDCASTDQITGYPHFSYQCSRWKYSSPHSCSLQDVAIKVFQRNQNVVAQQDSANVAIPTEHYEEFSLSLSGISSIAKSFSSLRQEAAVLWRLHHSNVVALAGVRLNVPALLLEWAPRGALDSYLSTYSLSLNKLHQSFAARYGLPPIVLLRILQQVMLIPFVNN